MYTVLECMSVETCVPRFTRGFHFYSLRASTISTLSPHVATHPYRRSGGEDITADKMVLWLASRDGVSVSFDEEAQEHVWKDAKGRKASYPSPYGLTLKMRMASALEIAGVAAWEAGQMPSSYMDIF